MAETTSPAITIAHRRGAQVGALSAPSRWRSCRTAIIGAASWRAAADGTAMIAYGAIASHAAKIEIPPLRSSRIVDEVNRQIQS